MSPELALLRYAVRATRWRPVAAGAGGGLVLVAATTMTSVVYDAVALTLILRFAALFGAIGLAFLFDDPSESSTAVSPSRRWRRVGLRPLVVLPGAVIWWAALVLLLRADADPEAWSAVPVAAVSLEMITLLVLSVALAAVVVRRPPHSGGGLLVAPVMVVVVLVGQVVPERVRFLPSPTAPNWDQVHHVWVGLLIAALLLLRSATRDLP